MKIIIFGFLFYSAITSAMEQLSLVIETEMQRDFRIAIQEGDANRVAQLADSLAGKHSNSRNFRVLINQPPIDIHYLNTLAKQKAKEKKASALQCCNGGIVKNIVWGIATLGAGVLNSYFFLFKPIDTLECNEDDKKGVAGLVTATLIATSVKSFWDAVKNREAYFAHLEQEQIKVIIEKMYDRHNPNPNRVHS